MTAHSCTFRSSARCVRSLGSFAVLAAALALPARPQNGSKNSSTGQAVLHLTVNVVPVVALPSPSVEPAKNLAITYNLPSNPSRLSVVREEHEFLPAPGGKEALLQTVTIVEQ